MQQDSLLDDTKVESSNGPVECLGQTFANEEARREHFTKLLSEKLKEPEFRNIEGFPIGTDEAILELSDPPYYTACPNPWLNDFVEYWESQKESSDDEYHRDPFSADVSEGKSDPIYSAHSYHTKVPHKAIMRYILHYTNPGDIVLDAFGGTGMTGVAAYLCGNHNIVNSLAEKSEPNVSNIEVGSRKVITGDLSPIASFISNTYNVGNKFDLLCKLERLVHKLEAEYNWIYKTKHSGEQSGVINCVIWSDIFECSECYQEVNYWEHAVSKSDAKVIDEFHCSSCSALLNKKKLNRVFQSKFDEMLKENVKLAKQVPVQINYSYEGKRYNKKPDSSDIDLLKKIDEMKIEGIGISQPLPPGTNTAQPKNSHGFSHVHHFYTKRSLLLLTHLHKVLENEKSLFLLTGIACRSTLMNRIHIKNFFFGGGGWNAGYLKGTLYVPSLPIETSIFQQLKDRLKTYKKAFVNLKNQDGIAVYTASSSSLDISSNSIDYIFIDPPFGANINYSELNSIWESWLKVGTNNHQEAIENKTQNKSLDDYRCIMQTCFKECYRLLKPGRWMTVEFSNTKSSVWNSIRLAISEAGFVIANVSALDKKQGSFKAVTTSTAVKQDLVISAYKPSMKFEQKFDDDDDIMAVWDFVKQHLRFLSIGKHIDNEIAPMPERDPRIIFDRMVSYFIVKNRQVPLSSQEFQNILRTKFSERDGMFFLPDQVSQYDKLRAKSNAVMQSTIFVDDEASSIEWLRSELKAKPKTYSEIHPLFLNELSGWKKNELQLELMTLLEQNFIKYDGTEEVPNQIHTYLSTNFKDMRGLAKDDPTLITKAKDRWYVPDPSKAGDIEKLRLRALLREFEGYKEEKKKIKQPRAEALRAGFNACWENQDLQMILDISAKIPPAVLQEDEKLLMFYDNALTLTSNDDDDWD